MSRDLYKRFYATRFVALVYAFGEKPFTTRDVVAELDGKRWNKASKRLKASRQMLLFKAYKFNLFKRGRQQNPKYIEAVYRPFGKGRKHYVYRLTNKGLEHAKWLVKNRLPPAGAIGLASLLSIKTPTTSRKGGERWRFLKRLWAASEVTDVITQSRLDKNDPTDLSKERAWALTDLAGAREVNKNYKAILALADAPNIKQDIAQETRIKTYAAFHETLVTCAVEIFNQAIFSKSQFETRQSIIGIVNLTLRRIQNSLFENIIPP